MDDRSRGHGGKNLSSGRQDGKGMGKGYLAKCRMVRGQELLREGGIGAYCTA